jgi:hypothetical protein
MKISQIAKAVTAGLLATASFALLSPAAEAALPKCNSARRGRIVGNQVCAIKGGAYRWVKVVPPAAAPATQAPAAPAAAPAPAAKPAIPASWVKYTADTGNWSMYAPADWTPYYPSVSGDRNAVSVTSAVDSSFAVFILNGLASSESPATHLAEEVNRLRSSTTENYIISNDTVASLNGRPLTSYDYYGQSLPSFKTRRMNVFLDNDRNTVVIEVRWRDGRSVTEEQKAIISTIVGSITISG